MRYCPTKINRIGNVPAIFYVFFPRKTPICVNAELVLKTIFYGRQFDGRRLSNKSDTVCVAW